MISYIIFFFGLVEIETLTLPAKGYGLFSLSPFNMAGLIRLLIYSSPLTFCSSYLDLSRLKATQNFTSESIR